MSMRELLMSSEKAEVIISQQKGGIVEMESEARKLWKDIPFKRTIIGEERSMTNKTVVWFITDDEYTEIRQSLDKSKRQYGMEKCGDRNLHYYSDGDTCICGQIPKDIFFASACSCGAYRNRKPVHKADCTYIQWAKKRNRWIAEHMKDEPPINPPIDAAHYRVKEK